MYKEQQDRRCSEGFHILFWQLQLSSENEAKATTSLLKSKKVMTFKFVSNSNRCSFLALAYKSAVCAAFTAYGSERKKAFVGRSAFQTCFKIWLGKENNYLCALPWQQRSKCPWAIQLTSHCSTGAAHWPATENNGYRMMLPGVKRCVL